MAERQADYHTVRKGERLLSRFVVEKDRHLLPFRGPQLPPDHWREQFLQRYSEDARQSRQFLITDPSVPCFNPRNDVAGNIPARDLTLCREVRLRPLAVSAQATHLRSADIEKFSTRVEIHT